MVAKAPPYTTQCAADVAAAAAGAELTELSEKTYLGLVKSYNDRRGFGFVACADLVALHGRDVYLPKAEAALAAAAGPAGENMAEDDVLQFRVRLSLEGYPQAAEARRLQKFRGSVVSVPRPAVSGGPALAGLLRSRDMAEALGVESVALGAEAVGQLRLEEGDEVSFCAPRAHGGEPLEAQLVCLEKTRRSAASVLGLFSVSLPRDGRRPDVTLQCHAFSDKVLVAGLPADVTEAELGHFFSKQGATNVAVARAAGGACYAAAQFPGIGAVSRLLSSKVHAFADEAETRVATLLPGASVADQPLLPALPKPLLVAGQESGTLLITWSPSVIAARYALEIRPAGAQAPWKAIDDLTRNSQRPECSSCRVTGLPTGIALEARVSFTTTCGTRSEPSESAEPRVAVPQLAARLEEAAPVAVPAAVFPPQTVFGLAQPCAPTLGWQQCVHGGPISAPPVPEVGWADGAGSSVLVRWLPVAHAAAYVVELSEAGGSSSERFVRAAAPPGCPVDLQIGGLRQLAPGGSYVARVRCVGACGCESVPSAAAWTPAWAPPGWPLAQAAGPGAAVLPRLLHSLGELASAPASPPPAQAAVAKPVPSPMVAVPLQEMHTAAMAGGTVFGSGFQAAGGLATQVASMDGGATFLMLD